MKQLLSTVRSNVTSHPTFYRFLFSGVAVELISEFTGHVYLFGQNLGGMLFLLSFLFWICASFTLPRTKRY